MLPPDQRYLQITVEIAGCTAGHVKYDKCSAVAEMGDHLATIDMGQKLGLCPFLGGAESPSNTMLPEPTPTFVPSGILINPAIWPQKTWAENWGEGAVPRWEGGSWVPI